MLHDLKLALRSLSRTPGFTAVVVLTLALGIGANTAIFSVVDAVLLRPLAYHDADRVVVVYGRNPGDDEVSPVPADFVDLRARTRTLEHVAGYREWAFNLRDGDRTEQVQGAMVTADFFRLLGVTPALGRMLTPDGSGRLPGGEVMISDRYWRTRMGASPDVLGRVLLVDGQPFTVVGVMPAAFTLPGDARLWLPSPYAVPPYPLRPNVDPSGRRDTNYFNTIARVKAGSTMEQARAEVFAILGDLAKQHGDDTPVVGATLLPIRVHQVGDSKLALLILFGASAVLLLIACANLANLFLADATSRQREWTVRAALGAGQWRLVRERLVGSLLLAGAGGLCGLLVAIWGVALLQAMAPDEIGAMIESTPDLRVLAFTAVVSLLTGLAFGIGPVLRSARSDLAGALREGSRGAGDSIGRRRVRGLLVISEVALAFVLAIGAGLLGKAFVRVQGVATGLDADRVQTIGLTLPASSYGESARQAEFVRALIERLDALPGVGSASVISRLPLNPGSSSRSIVLEGRNGAAGQELEPDYLTSGPAYLKTMGIALRGGA
jgi:putative ABC transport system permease protein